MTGTLPDPDAYSWDFERRGSVGVWYMSGWTGFPDEALEAASRHYRERGSRADIDATVAVFGDETSLPAETQEYMGEEWAANGAATDVEKVGFVSDGIVAMAVASNVDIPGAAVEHFDDLDAALDWARD